MILKRQMRWPNDRALLYSNTVNVVGLNIRVEQK